MTMETSIILLLLSVSLHILPSYLKPIETWGGKLGSHQGHLKTKDGVAAFEEILNKEYETIHGRILAVNLAHIRKRSALENDSELENDTVTENDTATENAFQEIEKANRDFLTNLYQGDIDLEGDAELEEYITTGGNSRNAIRQRKRLWTSRVIPYRIAPVLQHIASNIQTAINDFHSKTCVRFVPYNRHYHKNYIEFDSAKGCWSKVGKAYYGSGRQKISLGDGCTFVGTIIHEMMHSLGFFHEQARSDRDRYVKIYWENILDGFSDQFDKYTWKTIDDLGVSYDYQSIMHYDRMAFTKNGNPTIVAIGNENMEFKTPNYRLSTRDAVEINALYNCQMKTYGWSSWSGWTPCDKNCYRTRERFCYHSGNIMSCGGNVNTYGVEKQSAKCPTSICPVAVDGGWSRWSDWSDCSKTCNDGVKTRFRKCDRPEPLHGGKPCPGIVEIKALCIVKRCTLDPDDVDFENFRLGMWKNSKIDDFDWQFNKEYTQTINTGPNADHTTGKGYYLYAESSGRAGKRAQLVSPWQPAQADGKCLKLYYNMYGKTMGSLSIKLELSNGNNWLIFYETGNQGSNWKKGMGNIDVSLGLYYRLTIEARIGPGGYSDIAIDDVYIDPGLCDCQDDFFTCYIWARKGDCSTKRTWMEQNCKRSCQVCRKATTPPPPTIGSISSVCKDGTTFTSQCPAWANNGECKKNPVWMSENCRRSCNMCVPCTDSSVHCPTWAKSGSCAKNPAWMLPNCKLSCGQCT